MAFVRHGVRWIAVAALGAGSLTALAGVAAAGATPPTGPLTFYVTGTSGTDTNFCDVSSAPCRTIEHAVTEAGVADTAVTIEIGSEPTTYVYPEQVTVPPTSWTVTTTGPYGPTSLTIEPNPANTSPVVVEPPATAFTGPANLPAVPTADQAYDDFGGQNVHAIIGVGQPSQGYAALATVVDITGLTVDGANNPASALVAGIAYVNASGTVAGNTVTDLNSHPALWSPNQEHGIDVRGVNPGDAPTPSYTVSVEDNTLGSPTATDVAPDWVGHIPVDVNSTGSTVGTATAGSLSATITGNHVYGTPIDTTVVDNGADPTTSQNGITAAGLVGLSVSGNTVKDLQSAGYGGAVNVGTQAADASCSVAGNTLLADDYGVEFLGAKGCTASGNTITAGFFGVGVMTVPSWGPVDKTNQPSVDDTVSGNTITGTSTILTGRMISRVPIDGVLVPDGPTASVDGNTISGFLTDVYVGVDPLRYAGTHGEPTWTTTTVALPAAATWSTAGVTVNHNDLGPLATPRPPGIRSEGAQSIPNRPPVTFSSYGVACKYTPGGGGCSDATPLDGTNNWWGAADGPGPVGPGSGVPVSTDVNYTPWWVTPTGALPGAPGAPTTVVAVAPSNSSLVNAARVTWTAPPATITPVTSYTVTPNNQTTGGQGQPVTVNGTTTTATVTGLVGGDSYTFTVTATNAAGTGPGATSNAVVPVKVAPTASSSSGTTIPGTGTATTNPVTVPASGGSTVSVTASGSGPAGGAGTLTVSAYPSDPTGGFAIGSAYFDVSVTPGSTFTQVQFQVCGVPSGQVVQWWNPLTQTYQPASTQTAASGATRCVVVTINSGTSPSLSQLYGTVFAVAPAASATSGYWLAASDGGVFTYGNAAFYGSMGGKPLNQPIVGIAATPNNGGYWLVASDGGVFSFGNAAFYGSMGGKPLNQPIVGITPTLDGKGYWLVAKDGGVFAFGDATFSGSMGGKSLNAPVVGMAATPDGGGYWLVAKDGGVFAFGDATFSGSMGGKSLNAPVVGAAAGPSDAGYWLVAADGGIFSFGDATFKGSAGGLRLDQPVVGMAATPTAAGYYLTAADGGVFTYGDAAFQGSAGGLKLVKPVVGMAD
ncbi:MAG TPA: fibronectin type III domain-containing protein [Acidimicrobiales bacterium]|nr:fibronectin type III domain-containing protein [Acidimicrobiales bacterium]